MNFVLHYTAGNNSKFREMHYDCIQTNRTGNTNCYSIVPVNVKFYPTFL